MAKLKFDRSINLVINKDDNVTVPQDEVWKVFMSGPNQASIGIKINDQIVESITGGNTICTSLLGGGTKISGRGTVTGVTFKVIS